MHGRWPILSIILAMACSDLDPRAVDPLKTPSLARDKNSADTSTESGEREDLEAEPRLESEAETSSVAIEEKAAEPIAVSGAFFTCFLRQEQAPQGSYPIACQVPDKGSMEWTFTVSRGGNLPLPVFPILLDASARLWSLPIPVIPNDTFLLITARFQNEPVAFAHEALISETVLKPHKEANLPPPISLVDMPQLGLLSVETGGGTAYFSAGPLVADALGNLNVQTLKLSPQATATESIYKVSLRKTSTNGIQFVIHDPRRAGDAGACLDIRGQNFAGGEELIRFGCKTISASQNQNFTAMMDANKTSFKVQSTRVPSLCAGLEGGTGKIVLVNCAEGLSFQLTRTI